MNGNEDPRILDAKNSKYWAIAPVKGAAAGVVGMHYRLCNRETGREHSLVLAASGVTAGVDVKIPYFFKLKYAYFKTSRAVNFSDFQGNAASLFGAKFSAIAGRRNQQLTIYSSGYRSTELAKISFSGWTFGRIGWAAQGFVNGFVYVSYGSGRRKGTVQMTLVYEDLPYTDPTERINRFSIKAKESPLMGIPGDVLFGFDSSRIKREADSFLRRAAEIIEVRDRGKVVITGHTDAVGNSNYNKSLSIRRATAVKNWFVNHQVRRAMEFEVRGLGEDKPIEPNSLPDGSDNPEGRKANRRVEISFHQ